MNDIRNRDIKKNLFGFKLKQLSYIKIMDAYFYELIDIKTGAKHIHISRDDKENTFAIAFKTIPKDSTGVAHILEHTILCGSKKFPVRDPFFSMLKRSLSTFMNALTSSDWTMYPFATENKKDFYNLMDVYTNAVFFPKLDSLSFMQEGWRFEMVGDKLTYQGVVYNEMKGAMSLPEQILYRNVLKELLPDTTYQNNSGGEPLEIPKLTHKMLKDFHKEHYHPSNSFTFTYGDMPLKEHLKFLRNNVLKGFNKIKIDTDVEKNRRWKTHKVCEYPYPFSDSGKKENKYQFCIAWLVGDVQNIEETILLTILSYILVETSASPLRKALIESELGSSLSDMNGLEADMREAMFCCGLKDIKKADSKKVKKIIFDVLNEIVKNGLSDDLLKAALHQIEFSRKEITNRPYPYGIKLVLNISSIWFHGGNVEKVLNIDDSLDNVKKTIFKKNAIPNLIKKYFLNNEHYVEFLLKPDSKMSQKEDEKVKKELSKIREKLSSKEIKEIKKNSKELIKLQAQEEDISVLPTLKISDINKNIKSLKTQKINKNVFYYNVRSSDIFYFVFKSGLKKVEKELIPFVPIFSTVLSRIGTKNRDYSEISKLMSLYTGGIGFSFSACMKHNKKRDLIFFLESGAKALKENKPKMFEILEEIIFETNFNDLARLKTILMEYKANLEMSILQSGHIYAKMLASRKFTNLSKLREKWNGISQLHTIKKLTDNLNQKSLEELREILRKIYKFVFRQNNSFYAAIGDEELLKDADKNIFNIEKGFSKDTKSYFTYPAKEFESEVFNEGWTMPTNVAFTAEVFKTIDITHKDAPSLLVIAKLVQSMFLHKEIREKGGAYGAFANYDLEEGLFSFGSYRDPNIKETFDVYSRVGDFIKNRNNFTNQDIKEAILQVCSGMYKPDTKVGLAQKTFLRKITNLKDSDRKEFKTRLLGLNKDKIVKSAENYFGEDIKSSKVAISSPEKFKNIKNNMKLYKI